MKLFKLSVCAAFAAFMFTACDDSSSASSDDGKVSYDCTVKDGVKVVYPKGGESFKMGETITVIYGSDVQGSGYHEGVYFLIVLRIHQTVKIHLNIVSRCIRQKLIDEEILHPRHIQEYVAAFCYLKSGLCHLYYSLAMFPNLTYLGIHVRFAIPTGPFLCLAMLTAHVISLTSAFSSSLL